MKKKKVKKLFKKADWFNKSKRGDLERIIYNINQNDVPFQDRGK